VKTNDPRQVKDFIGCIDTAAQARPNRSFAATARPRPRTKWRAQHQRESGFCLAGLDPAVTAEQPISIRTSLAIVDAMLRLQIKWK